MKLRPASEFLARDDRAEPLFTKAAALHHLQKTLARVLPANLAPHCSVANFKNGHLIVFAANNAVAAKLRMITGGLPDKITRLITQGAPQVTAVTVEVQYRAAAAARREKTVGLSPQASSHLRNFATQLPDSELKNAIASLASRVSKNA